MTSVEKRRSSRKSSKHRKHSDGGFSDTSSGGSFLDENDREVSSLTDRAFRSLCIGDEAVYNDSDLSLSSPCTQRNRQLAFSQSDRDIGTEAREVEELKRSGNENFGLRMQQYGQAWIHGGMYGAEIHSDPQWGGCGQQTQGRVSATFQHSFVETSHLGKSLNDEELSSFSNGATELSSQRRSRSRVSSLIRAFNSEGHRDGAAMNDKLREWNNEPSWDKSALMSIQRELSEFSTSYQQNFNSGHYPSAGPFSSRDTNFYSSEVAAVAHMSHNSVSSFIRSSHSNHGMSAQVNCNSNFFIHSEFSPFKVWRDHNRFPFQRGEVSGFMHASEFPKWYETPMYKELSLENHPQAPYRGVRHHRNSLAPMALPVPPYHTATSSVLQKASAVEKRCESELASNYPRRRQTQSLGTNKLPSQRPSTASPSTEMSRRVRDTISSVKALQQKIEIMTEQKITTGVLADGVLYGNDNFIHSGNSVPTLQPNASSNTGTTPFNVSQKLTPTAHAHQDADTSGVQQYNVSPQPVEHPPVRAESRGATPDIRMSTYKSRATSLLFNLKDNRKRVKSTYSPTKFKGLDTQQKNKQASAQEQRETVIDIPEALDSDMQSFQLEESTRTNAAGNQYHSPGLTLTTQPTRENTGQYQGNTSGDYQTAQMQGQMVRHAGCSGFIPENYTSNQLTNGQNPNEYLASFTPCGQGGMHHTGTSERLKQSYTDMGTSRLKTDSNQNREHLISKENTDQAFNETVERKLTSVDRYDPLKTRKYDYNNVTSKDERRQTNNQDTEKFNLKAAVSPQKLETALENSRQENPLSRIKDIEKVELKESFGFVISPHKNHGLISSNVPKQLQEQQGRLENERSYHRYTDQEYNNKHELDPKANETMQKTGQMETGTNNNQKPSSPHSNNAPDSAKTNLTKDRQFVVRGEQVMAEHRTEKHTQAELAKAQQRAQVQQPTAESAGLILVEQTGSGKVKTEESKSEPMRPESVVQTKEEHIKDEKKREQAKLSRHEQSELTGEEQTAAKQTGVQKLTDEPKNVTEKSSNKYIREEQGKQVKAEQAEKEKNKEEARKTELTNTEQTRPAKSQQAETEKTTWENITTEHVKEEQLSSEQAKREHMEPEQIRIEKINAKPTGTDHGKAEQTEQMKEPQSKIKHMKTKEAEVGEVKADNVRVEDARQAKNEKDSFHLEHVNAEKPPKHIFTAKGTKLEERKPTQTKLEETKPKQTKAELHKTGLLERSAELASKLAATQHARSEPDRVEQVKTELAKAKAELAKIKEKMRAEEQQRRLTEKEKQWGAAQEHQKREPEKQQGTAAQEEHQKSAVQKEQQRRVAEEQQNRVCLSEEQRQAKKMKEKILEGNKRKEREEKGNHIPEEICVVIEEQNTLQQQQIEKERTEKGEFTRVQKHEDDELKKAAQNEKIMKEREEQLAKNESARSLEEKMVAEELMVVERERLIQTKPREEDINLVTQREKARAAQMEKQRRAAHNMDALQYYAITSTGTERKSTERQQSSPVPSQQRNNPLRPESTDESIYNSRHYRPHAPASPAPSLPRSNTSSPALGAKPSMFRVKDNTIRGSFFTKSVKPRFHRSFGEVSPMDRASDRGEDEQETMRHGAGTPVYPDMGLNRLAAINESSASPSTSLSKDFSISHHRPYSRRSIVMDEDESRSVISNLSEDVESLATSAADLTDIRGLLDCDRPDSACSFSSDVSRSLGKPPTVPPKSEKALRRAQRLTSRRMKKDLSKAAAGTPVGVDKEVSSIPSSSSEVCSSNCHAVASPHFSPPVSLAHAPTLGSSLPSSSSEHQSVHCTLNASTHATGPVSLPFSSPHATSTHPAVSPHASSPASQPAAPKPVAHVPSSPTLYHANHPTPVTQYHVESSRYPQSFPLTQRKVLQDLGSGQYFVVDVPVQVKTKTFFDPETGKYVQLNVRESGQSISQPQPQPKTELKPQQQPLPQPSIAGKPIVFYHGYPGYPQSYPPAAINYVHPNRSSAPGTLHHDQQPPRESHSYRIVAVEGEQNAQGHRYSPEKTPYLDTVNDADKSYNPVRETNSQLTGSLVCDNVGLAELKAPAEALPQQFSLPNKAAGFIPLGQSDNHSQRQAHATLSSS
ncbi:cardiac-enriched FHL2-interacting protein [Xenentodon cancila]